MFKRIVRKVGGLLYKAMKSLKTDGFRGFIIKSKNYIVFHLSKSKVLPVERELKDVLFINGCTLEHPERYRVDHQIEQLVAAGMSVDKIFSNDVNLDIVKYYRCFIIFRCPVTPQVTEFIKQAKYYNKKVFFDVDDLVINLEYTNTIPFVQQMKPRQKWSYDCGVVQMEETLKQCDYLITTTNGMKKGLERYGKDIYINRNVASEEMVRLSLEATKKVKKDSDKIVLGYLSGSITHNPDMELIKEPIIKLMRKYKNVCLTIAGILDVPEDFREFGERVKTVPFGDWRKLPELIAGLDINLAPLTESFFNEAKSENKWTEAALCKVVTVASNLGAFKEIVKNGETGLLCDNQEEWFNELEKLVTKPDMREMIAESAFKVAIKDYVTTYTGSGLMKFIESKLAPNIGMVLPSTNISGGVMVALKHCQILREHGYDVTVLNMDSHDNNVLNNDGELNVVSFVKHSIKARFYAMVATMYTTVDFIKKYPDVKRRLYLVQNKESDFYEYGNYLKFVAESTYNDEFSNLEYITISKWCEEWLREDFGKKVKYAPNGLNINRFERKNRVIDKNDRIKILIEGDSESYYKNVDESFRIANKLDRDKYEIIYLSYNGLPKKWYKVDKFYHNIPYDRVSEVYQEADILLKSSILESFSYPPLEMMATGGFVVVAPNAGNVEYLKDGVNCLFYELGNLDDAIEQIGRLVDDEKLRKTLIDNSKKTVKERDWNRVEKEVVELYGEFQPKRKAVSRVLGQGSNEPIILYGQAYERIKLIEEAKKKGKRIAIYLVENKLIAQFRYRCQNVLETTLGSEKWQAVYFTDSEIDDLKEMILSCDIFIIERRSAWEGNVFGLIDLCKKNGIKVVFDVDDLIFDLRDMGVLMKSINSKNLFYWFGYILGVRKIAKRTDGFIATNDYLGKKISKSFRKPVKTIRNSLNSEQVKISETICEKKDKSIFKIGYFSGTPTHANDFRLILPELRKFLDKYDDTVIEVVGFLDLGAEIEKMFWDGKIRFSPIADFVKLQELMGSVDVNIAPLLDNKFTNCKSELKFFEAAIAKTATIASPTYTFKKAITDGENGFLAKPDEWCDKLEYLYRHHDKNQKIALKAKKYALEHYYGEEFLKEVENTYDYFAK